MDDRWKLAEKDEDAEGPYWATFTDSGKKDDFWWSALVKWDGCIELTRRFNSSDKDEMSDRIHLCDLDNVIEKLKDLRDAAKAVLGPRHGLYES